MSSEMTRPRRVLTDACERTWVAGTTTAMTRSGPSQPDLIQLQWCHDDAIVFFSCRSFGACVTLETLKPECVLVYVDIACTSYSMPLSTIEPSARSISRS